MRKRKIVVTTLLILSLGLTACGSKNKETTPVNSNVETSQTQEPKTLVKIAELDEIASKVTEEIKKDETLKEIEKINISAGTTTNINAQIQVTKETTKERVEEISQKVYDKYSELLLETNEKLAEKYTFQISVVDEEGGNEIHSEVIHEQEA